MDPAPAPPPLAPWEADKARGNAAFSGGEFTLSISCYSAALSGSPPPNQLHLLHSNRAAAFLARAVPGDALAALADANECLRHEPTFVRGFHRKAGALLALGEHAQAVSVASRGLRLDPSNAPLREMLLAAQAGLVAARGSAEAAEVAAAAADKPQQSLDEAFAAFDAEIALLAPVAMPPPAADGGSGQGRDRLAAMGPPPRPPVPPTPSSSALFVMDGGRAEHDSASSGSERDGDGRPPPGVSAGMSPLEIAAQSAALASADLGTGVDQISRLMQHNYRWINLNPYEVLGLPLTANDDDVKGRYRRLSGLVHPDKQPGDTRAPTAFQEVKKAYDTLMDPARRLVVDAVARDAVRRAKLAAKAAAAARGGPGKRGPPPPPPSAEDVLRATRAAFAELEQRKKSFEHRVKAAAVRDGAAAAEVVATEVAGNAAEKVWRAGEEARKASWEAFKGKRGRGEGEREEPAPKR